jgi:septal ring factor EnvC (AmiA/AmiB activator)
MKKIILLIVLLTLTSTSFGQFWRSKPKATPKPTPVTVEKIKTPVQDAKLIVKELKNELNVAKTENNKLKENLSKAKTDLNNSFVQINKLEKDINTLKEWGVVQQAEAQRWLQKYTDAVKRYHRLKLIAAIIAAAGGVFLGLQFMNMVPPPYNLLVPVGGAGLFATLIWIFL